MKKIFLLSVIVTLMFSLSACGKPDKSYTSQSLELPASIKVLEIIKSQNWQLSVQKDNKTYTVLLDKEIQVFFKDKQVVKESIQKNQTLYLEGQTREGISFANKAVISIWPGRVEKGVDIIIDPKSIPKKISKYLEDNHPELEITEDTIWQTLKRPTKTPQNNIMDLYNNSLSLLAVKYEEGNKSKTYTILLTPSLDSQVQWSGFIKPDGQIVETLYEKN